MNFYQDISLKDKHTFHLDAKTLYWAEVTNKEDIFSLISNERFNNLPFFVIGSGSNLLFRNDYNGILIHSGFRGFEVIKEDSQNVWVKVGSGIIWDDFVEEVVNRGWSGSENLSAIPGEIGASPVQNIGAYGREASDIIEQVDFFDFDLKDFRTFSKEDCQFGYRDSIFKNSLRNKCFVTHVTFKLSKTFIPEIKYGDIADRIKIKGNCSLKNVRETIIEIRNEKLPDHNLIGNAGSFYMNPVISAEEFSEISKRFENIPAWKQNSGNYKVSAAWLIEKSGWKGKSMGNAAVHKDQALVLINNGNAKPEEILTLSDKIINDVNETFGIILHPEVIIV